MSYVETISQAYPDVQVVATGPNYADIQWLVGGPIAQADLDAASLEVQKAITKQAINDYRDTIKGQGMWYQGHFWDTSDSARDNITATVTACAAGLVLPAGFTWRDNANIDVPANNAFMIPFGISVMSYISSLYSASWAFKAEVDSLTDLASVQNYDIAGQSWPTNNYDGSKPVGA